jgi:S1-C subfamily serine protease
VPVLFLFTGTHKDYHKPSDRAELINYPGEARVVSYAERIIENFDEKGVKPKYTLTKSNMTGGKSKFKVTLGIMPDYTYQDKGVKVDGVSDSKPAAKAGVQAGDIIIQLGDVKVQGMQTYMEALGSFTPGDVTKVIVLRNGKEVSMPLEFKK